MTVTVLKALLKEKRLRSIHDVLSMYNPVDLAELLSELDDRELATVFRILDKPKAAEVFTYMDKDLRQELIKTFSSAEINSLFEELYADDAADFLSDMPANFVTQLLENVGPETRRTINNLLQYPDDSAGSIMTVEFVELDPEMTVSGALDKIRRVGIDSETVYNCYAVKKHKLLGVPQELLDTKGAVSFEVAVELARRVREKLGSTFGVGITGLAGPDGDGVHEVGTVFISLADGENVWVREKHITQRERAQVRLYACQNAFDMIRRRLDGCDVGEIRVDP